MTLKGFFPLGSKVEIRDSKLIVQRAYISDCGEDKECVILSLAK